MEHYSIVMNVPIDRVFQYFSKFDEYQTRYKKYCATSEITKCNGNIVYTNEIWNLTLGNDVMHILLNIKYTLIPNTEIQYEFLDDYKSDNISSFRFEDRGTQTLLLANRPPLDVLAFSYGRKGEEYNKLIEYFTRTDSTFLTGQLWGYRPGDECPQCHKGHLQLRFNREITESTAERREIEHFVCGNCRHEFQSAYFDL